MKAAFRTALLALALAAPHMARADDAPLTYNIGSLQKALEWMPLQGPFLRGIVVTVLVNDQPIKALIDTGSTGVESLRLNANVATRLGIPVKQGSVAGTYAGTASYQTAVLPKLEFGWLTIGNLPIRVGPGLGLDPGVEAVIGLNILKLGTLEADPDNRRVRFLLPGELSREKAAPNVMPLLAGPDNPFISLSADLCGVPTTLALDTGLNADLMVSEDSLPPQACRSALSSDVQSGRNLNTRLGLGSASLGQVPTGPVLVEVLPSQNATRLRIKGAIGQGILRRYAFAIDRASDRFALFGPAHLDQSGERPRIGLQFRQLADRLEITHIQPNSPALSSGLKVGDTICKVGGKAIADWHGAWNTNPAAGLPVNLETCDGRSATIVAVDFLRPPGAIPPLDLASLSTQVGWFTQAVSDCSDSHAPNRAQACTTVLNAPAATRAFIDFRQLIWLQRAKAEEAAGDVADARKDYAAELQAFPDNADALAGIGRLTQNGKAASAQ